MCEILLTKNARKRTYANLHYTPYLPTVRCRGGFSLLFVGRKAMEIYMPGYHYDFPFDIMDVAGILNLRVRRRGNRSVYTDCPLCGDTRGKMNLNLEKNQFRCNYCQTGGGAIGLYASVHGISNSDAYSEICEILYGKAKPKDYKVIAPKKAKPVLLESAELASLYDRNQTFELLLSQLTLTPTHLRNLKRRGLSEEMIQRAGYRSTPPFGFDKIAEKLYAKGCVIEGVPGFYQRNTGNWTINFTSRCSGILIPVRSMAGLIQAFQIRLDKPFVDKKGRETKYLWLSSVDERKGVSSGSPAHFVGDPCDKTVFVTEGPLKADTAHCLSGRTFLAAAGAGNIESFRKPFEILKQNGTQNIYETYDMDKYANVNVQKGALRLHELIEEMGFRTKIMSWDKDYKGIDDFLLSKHRNEG